MEIKIILTVIIGALTQIGSVQIFDDSGCTYTGANCPIMPCCNYKFECKLTTLSLFSLPPDLYELSARNKTYRCLDKIPLGGSCLFHEECSHITNSRCISSLCKCMSPYYNYEGRCYACNVKAYRPCCDPDYKCTKLERGAANRIFRCLKSSVKLKESCHRDIDCYTIDFAECKNGKCKCQDNFTAMGEIKCVPLLGGFCFKNDDCIIQLYNSSCVDNKCQCQKNFIALKENECTELKLGISCQSHEDCREISNSKSYEYN